MFQINKCCYPFDRLALINQKIICTKRKISVKYDLRPISVSKVEAKCLVAQSRTVKIKMGIY